MMYQLGSAEPATPKSVLFLENNRNTRETVTWTLQQHGFQTFEAADGIAVRQLLERRHADIDVAILDINLEGSITPSETGFEIGQELIDAQPDLPPRRIFYSGREDKYEYYQKAVRLGADVYIRKSSPVEVLYNHVYTSTLVRSLSPVRPEISEKISQIAERNLDQSAAVIYLCQQVIAPEVKECLGVPFLFLVSDEKGIRPLSPEPELLQDITAEWGKIQDQTFLADINNPFLLSVENFDSLFSTGKRSHESPFLGANFIPLYDEGSFRLSMGILPTNEAEILREQKNPRRYAQNLYSSIREPVAKQFKYLSRLKETIERTKLRHTSTFCLYVGKTQIDALEESLENEEIAPENPCFRRLKRLADDLQATGLEFSRLLDNHEPAKHPKEMNFSARTVVTEAWNMLAEQGVVNPKTFEITHTGPDVQIPIEHEDLFLATFRMLEWLAQRQDKIASDASRRAIDVLYERQPGRVAIRFTDHSWQLGERLRKKLFEPFTQGTTTPVETGVKGEPRPGLYLPLYLVKVLLTVKNDGSLEDRTDELESNEVGNCFVFAFPVEDN